MTSDLNRSEVILCEGIMKKYVVVSYAAIPWSALPLQMKSP